MSTETAYIGLGGNLGNPFDTIQAALQQLKASAGIASLRVSPFYRTKPVEARGPDFCNAVAEITTDQSPAQLLDLLLSTEQAFGRQRSEWHAPRTLDLDLIAYGTTRILGSQLTVPHPRAHERAFVLIPICTLNPSVLLGPPEAAQLAPASVWQAALSAAERAHVVPW